jgi:hypothetical protein
MDLHDRRTVIAGEWPSGLAVTTVPGRLQTQRGDEMLQLRDSDGWVQDFDPLGESEREDIPH